MVTDLGEELCRQENLRDRLLKNLVTKFSENVRLNAGTSVNIVKNTLNLQFGGIQADAVLASLRQVEASRASACSAGLEEASHVLIAMGKSHAEAEESIRLSLGRYTSEEEIDVAIQDLTAAVTRVRAFNG